MDRYLFSADNVRQLVLSFLITDLGLIPYAALSLMLTLLFRNSVVSISVGLALLLLVETTAYTILASIGNSVTLEISKYLPIALEAGLRDAVMGSSVPVASSDYLSPPLCVIFLLVYTILFTGIGIWRFTRQNFTD